MTLRSIAGTALLAMSLLLGAGCMNSGGDITVIHGPDPYEDGEISFALSTQGALAADDDGRVLGFKVRIFREVPDSWDDSAYFHSDCSPASSAFKVDHLKTGAGFVLVYEGYSGKWTDCTAGAPCLGPDDLHPWGQMSDGTGGTFSDCAVCDRCEGAKADHPNGRRVQSCLCEPEALVELGVRGGITISEIGIGEAFYYVQVNRAGAFTAFPLPGPELTGGTVCATDADCRKKIDCAPDETCADGTKYLVHPQAECDGGVCTLASLFPLNTREARAFHTAVATDNGFVALLGGYNVTNATQLAVNDTGEESFDANTALFSDPEFVGLSDPPALTTNVDLGGGRVALLGGASTLKGFPFVLVPGSPECEGTNACSMNVSNKVQLVDVVQTRTDVFDLPVHTLGGQAALVGIAGGQRYIYLRPGVVQESLAGFSFGTQPYLFTLGDDLTLGCAVSEDGAAPEDTSKCLPLSGTDLEPRIWPVGACLSELDKVCAEYVVLGGNLKNNGPDAFAEIYLAELGTVQPLKGDASLPPTLLGAESAVLQDRIWTFGGMTGDGKLDAGPMVFDVDVQGTIKARQVLISQDDRKVLQRIFHHVTPLEDGKTVLVTGGYRGNDVVLDTWALLEITGDQIQVRAKGNLSTPRLGHEATLIRGGLLRGSVLVTGGMMSLAIGADLSTGAELYLALD